MNRLMRVAGSCRGFTFAFTRTSRGLPEVLRPVIVSANESAKQKRGQGHLLSSAPFSTMAEHVGEVKNVDYEGLLKEQKDPKVLIIDVREQKEIDETGKLPGSIHIPMGNVSKVLETLSDDEFQKQYQKPKPQKDTKIILSCRLGGRSAKVQEELQKIGYKNSWNYTGGWAEWESKQKS